MSWAAIAIGSRAPTKRIFIAALGTEINQFVPFPTGLRGYQEHGVWRGDAPTARADQLHRATARLAQGDRGARRTAIEGLATFAAPSGTTVRGRSRRLSRRNPRTASRAPLPLDGVLINVHGAMVADGYDDCEGDLLVGARDRRPRRGDRRGVRPAPPSERALMLDSADVLIGYKEYPHTDTMERAAELFAIVADTIDGKVKPVMARRDCRMIAQYRTSVPPISEFVTRMKSFEGKDGILSVSLSHGFAFADVEDVGTSTLVVADRDRAKAQALAEQLGRELWDNRERYATVPHDRRGHGARGLAQSRGRWCWPIAPTIPARRPRFDLPAAGAGRARDRAGAVRRDGDPMAFRVAEEAGEGARLRMQLGGKSGEVSGSRSISTSR